MSLQRLIVDSLVAVSSWNGGQQSTSTDACPEYDHVEYSAPHDNWQRSIHLENVPIHRRVRADISNEKRQRSPHGTASYALEEPDTTKPGAWTSVVDVFGNEVRPIYLRIRLIDHVSAGVRVHWVNEQLLWLQMWRGRIASTESFSTSTPVGSSTRRARTGEAGAS